MNSKMQIGFSQRIRLDWLERTAASFLAGNTKEEIKTLLQDHLQDQLSIGGTSKRGNREKAITILMKIWVTIPSIIEPLRNDGLELLKRLPMDDHLAVHWGMAMAVYPFLGLVAETVGRLLRLQGAMAVAQVQRRVREQLGERETVSRATRRTLRCFVDWGVLRKTKEKGVYRATSFRTVNDKKLAIWLIEATLVANGADYILLKAISQTPALFPFAIDVPKITDFENHDRLELFRQGLDENLVTFRG